MFEQFFLNGKYSDQEKLAITRHALWPVYAALHNVSEGKIRIAELTEEAFVLRAQVYEQSIRP